MCVTVLRMYSLGDSTDPHLYSVQRSLTEDALRVEGVLLFCLFFFFVFPTLLARTLGGDPSVSESVSRIARTMECALVVSKGNYGFSV
jgi:hypothetical protein